MPSPSDHTHTDPPLWSIGIAVIIILLAPLVLYSLAPTGPIREGDTVFSEGQQHVRIHHTATGKEAKDNTCLLDPNSPLIVVRSLADPPDSSLIAHVQGNPSGEWPFCQVHAEVVLKTHQVFQKPAVFGMVRESLIGLFRR
ncbi:MAG: hypothetical protein KF722_11425 [Nitrospira sp.]|nr:hypothetical protein [Nitrospira sp.]